MSTQGNYRRPRHGRDSVLRAAITVAVVGLSLLAFGVASGRTSAGSGPSLTTSTGCGGGGDSAIHATGSGSEGGGSCGCGTPSIVTTQQPASGPVGALYKDKATLSGLGGSGGGGEGDGEHSSSSTVHSGTDCGGGGGDSAVHSTPQATCSNGETSGDESGDKSSDESGDKSSDESGDKSSDESGYKSGDESGDKSGDGSGQESAGESNGNGGDDSEGSQDGCNSSSGSITFRLYSARDCSGSVLDTETVDNVSANGDYTTPTGFRIQNAGTYYWVASFSGDANDKSFTSGCNDEPVVVTPSGSKTSPRITTALSASVGNVGAIVHDSATLSGATADATGTVTYSVYSDSSCATRVADGGTVQVTNGSVPSSHDVGFGAAGTYYWQASYSGDGSNGSAVSACTDERLVIGSGPGGSASIDLAVAKVGAPNPATVGGHITWTIVVTNNGPSTATGVVIADAIPSGNTYVAASTTQGSCTGGAILGCSLGTLAPGGTVTITLVTAPTAAGTVTNTVTVVGNQPETNTANNTATSSVVVVQGPFKPVAYCTAVSGISPQQLFVGRNSTLTIHVTRHGVPVKGVRVRITGPRLNLRTKPSNARGLIKQRVRPGRAGIVILTPIASPRCGTKRLGVTGVFTPPVTG